MNRWSAKLRALAELARLSNLPTVWSNVLVGGAIGVNAWKDGGGLSLPPWGADARQWCKLAAAGAAVSLLYVGGMALNDAADYRYDRGERPERPIPSGRVRLSTAYRFVLACFIAGLALLAAVDWLALALGAALVASIMAYDFLHKAMARAVVLMGVCRCLVYFVAAAAVRPGGGAVAGAVASAQGAAGGGSAGPWQLAAWLGGILGLYTVAITIVARAEAGSVIDVRKWLSVAMPAGVLLAAARVQPSQWVYSAAAGAALISWMALAVRFVLMQPPRTIRAVLTWLSGMCLVDAYFLTLLDQPALAPAAGACFVVTALGHRRILGT